MSRARRAALWVLTALCIWGAFAASARMTLRYPALSLRYDAPVDAQLVRSALKQAQGERMPTFWSETEGDVQSRFRTSRALCIGVSGDASLVWPERFLAGGWFGPMASGCCAVSGQAALTLFGSLDVVGQTLTREGETYFVSGVFEGEQCVVVYAAPDDAEFHGIEVETAGENPRADALAFAAAADLAEPDDIVYESVMAGLARTAAWLPLLAACLPAAAALWRSVRRRAPRSVCLFALALLAALALPGVLDALPGWLIPPQWSDFSFWPELAHAAADRWTEWLSLDPAARDVEIKRLLLAQGVCVTAALCCTASLCGRNRKKPGPRTGLFWSR